MTDGGDGFEIIVNVTDPRWDEAAGPDVSGLVARAVRAALDAGAATPPAEVSVRLTNDVEIHALNRDWRDRDAPTNVLAFALDEDQGQVAGTPVRVLGDVVVAYETCAREAVRDAKPLADHLAHLVVHGTLHLLGYDHEADAEAEAMERTEADVLAGLGIPDPHADSAAA